jgi:probable F420-dependent oxidoreductase
MPQDARDQLGPFGVWRSGSMVTTDLAAGLERLGFGALWLGGSPAGDLALAEQLLAVTARIVIGTSIVNIWADEPQEVAASFARVHGRYPGRFMLGVGAGHREATSRYARPFEAMTVYVDALRRAGVPSASLVLAALGPKMLRLAAQRTAGAIPYLVTPAYTRQARAIMGRGPLLAPEQKVVLDADLERGRALSRRRVSQPYLGLVNYTSNLRRLGWSEADLSDGGSDALIDALVPHGAGEHVAACLREHLYAGADHVAVQLLTEPEADPLESFGQLARALGLSERPA